MTGRNRIDGVKTRGGSRPGISSGGALETGPRGTRPEGGVKPDQALVRNGRTCRLDAKGDVRAGSPRKDQRTDARHRGGAARSRMEGPVIPASVTLDGPVLSVRPRRGIRQDFPRPV